MRFKHKKSALLVIFFIALFLLVSCAPTGSVARGWSGPALGENDLFVGTMDGKLAAVNLSTRNRSWSDFKFEPPKATGAFGCASGPTSVAIYGTPAVGGELVYAAGYDGKIYAINTATGALRWVYPRQDYIGAVAGSLVLGGGKLVFGSSDGSVYALDAATGDFQWKYQTGDKVWSTPAIDANTVYIGSFDKKMYALNLADGGKKWEYTVDGAIAARPLVKGGVVYFGSFGRHFYALNAADGSLKWESPVVAGNWFWADAVAPDSAIYAPSLDNFMYVFKPEDGSLVARYDLQSPISSSPVVSGSAVIAATREGKIFALETGAIQPRQIADLGQPVSASLGIKTGVVYVHNDQDTLYAVDVQSGTVLWTLPLKT